MLHGIIELIGKLVFRKGANSITIQTPATVTTSYTLTLPGQLPASTQNLTISATGQAAYTTIGTTAHRQAFTNTNLTTGVLTVTHNLGQKFCQVQVSDSSDKVIIPDDITLTSATACSIDLTSFGTLTGTWNVVVIG